MAALHPQLAKDCLVLGQFRLCRLLLMNDANYPWFILVPDREGVKEIYQLAEDDQQQFLRESSILSRVLMEVFAGEKLNVAALGNVVPQLHIHHIVRFQHDPAWPAPVWGKVPVKPYSEKALSSTVEKVLASLPVTFTPTYDASE